MKNFKRTLCLFMAMAMICMLPGMTHIVSAAKTSMSDATQSEASSAVQTDQNIQTQPLQSALPKSELSETYQSGILKQNALFNEERSTTLAASSETQNAPDMMYALRKVNPVFSSKNNSNENVDLNTGSLNLSYPLANMQGVNGMDLSLSLKYSSSASNTKDRGYIDCENIHVGYIVQCSISGSNISVDGVETIIEVTTDNYYYVSVDEYNDFIDFLEGGPYITILEDGSIQIRDYQYYAHFLVYEPRFNGVAVDKPFSIATNGLGYGWSFNIPYIKTLTSFDEDGNPQDYYKTIILDNGKGLVLDGDTLCDFIITEENSFSDIQSIIEYTDYQYTPSNETINGQVAANVLSYKDGTKYYFDENDLCIGKEDRFGNQIFYEYENDKLVSLSDGFGRTILLTWEDSEVLVTSSDASSVKITIGENAVSSICYNNTETFDFTYVTQNTTFGTNSVIIPYVLLTEIAHPNQCTSTYEYVANTVYRPDNTIDQVFQLSKRYDTVNNVQKNTINYSYNGNYMSDYSEANEELVQNQESDNIWTHNGIDYDAYSIISNYSTTVSDGISETIYSFNPNGYCNSIEVKENGISVSVKEYLYDCDKLIAQRETLADSAGDAMSHFTTYTYDTMKNVVSVKKFQNGSDVYYAETATYDNPYSLITSSSVNGITTNYTYSTDGKTLSSVETKEGINLREKTEYTYLTNGNIQTEKVYVYPQGTLFTKTYTYDSNNLFPISTTMDSIKDSDGNAKSNITRSATYDIAGRVLSETDGNGNTTSYTYDSRGRLIQTDYPDGTYETVTYDIPNRKTTNRNRAGYTQIHQYDENGNLLSVKESDGTLLASYTYDIRGRILTERVYQTADTWRETRYTYDALDRPLAVNIYDKNNNLLSSESYVYDIVSLNGETLLKTTKTVLGDSFAPTSETFEYKDVYGRTVRSGGMFDGAELAKTFTYDNLDRLLTETDELGKTTTYTYDYAGNVLTATDAFGATITYTYDSMGNVLTMTDALGSTVTYTYDVLGRQLTQTVPFTNTTAQVTKYDYDANGNVTMIHVSRSGSSFTKTVNTYDSMNRLTKTASYDGTTIALTTEYTYNAYDKPLTMTVGNSTTVYEYNIRGEQTKIKDALNQNETFSYDLGGNLVSKTDRNGTTFTCVYDQMGRLLNETAVNGNKTEVRVYAYSIAGALISETNGIVTITRKYDVLGRLIEETETSADGTAVSRYAYTVRGERERYALTLNGEEILSEYYEYDDLGRLWKVYDSTAVWSIDDGVEISGGIENGFDAYPDLPIYTICAVGYYEEGLRYRLVPLTNATDAFDLTYTQNGTTYGVCFEENRSMVGAIGAGNNVIDVYYEGEIVERYEISFNGGLSMALFGYYVFDENGNVMQSIAVMGEDFDSEIPTLELMVLHGHIDFGQYMTYSLRSADATETLIATYTYDANGNRTSLTYSNGTTTTYAYNQANLVTSVVNKKGNTTLSSHSYTYYLDGNIASENENGTTKTYEYDGLGRLTREAKNGTITLYTYDANGNRATMTQNGVATTYTYDANNRLLKETVAGAVTTYTYDANGNLINAWNSGNPVGAYGYNLFGNQVSFTPEGVLYTYYTYRPDGLRHSIGDTVHIWDGANIVADIDGNNVSVYIRGVNLIYADDGDRAYYHFNAHGDVVVLTNANGTKTKSYSYNAFGVEYNEAALDSNPFRYCGEYYDKETQTIYLRARYYDAKQGRFTQEDTHWNVSNMIYGDDPDNTVPDQSVIIQSGNLYAYCSNNPIIYIDPTGEWNWGGVIAGLGIIAGAVITVATFGVGSMVGAVVASAAITTGIAVTAAAATDSTIVVDLSFSKTVNDTYGKTGCSLVVDFEPDSASGYLYPHVGAGEGYNEGLAYSVGFVDNFEKPEDYAGLFYDVNGGNIFGVDHCWGPRKYSSDTAQATSLTFSTGPSWGAGSDWYFDPIPLF